MIRVRSRWATVFAIVLACSGGGLSASSAAATTTHDATAICTYDPAPPSALLTCAPSRANGAGRSVRVAPTKAAIPSMAQRDGGSRRSTGTRIATNSVDDLAGTACRTNSFIPSTHVLMADGSTKPIEDVEVGDLVLATDPETGEQGARRVTDLIVGEGLKELVDVEVDGEIITATGGHPFWLDDAGAWVDADDLETGDRLLLADGTTVAVDSVRERAEVLRVHNLTVDGIHTYHVLAGDGAVLVHNCRNPWAITPEGTAATRNGPFGRLWKSKSDGLWWSKDTAGHGKSAWKVYDETSEGLVWRADADEFGTFIDPGAKHKGPTGLFIPWKDLGR